MCYRAHYDYQLSRIRMNEIEEVAFYLLSLFSFLLFFYFLFFIFYFLFFIFYLFIYLFFFILHSAPLIPAPQTLSLKSLSNPPRGITKALPQGPGL